LKAAYKEAIKKANISYNGAHLILSNIRKDCTSESLEKIVCNSCELNTSFTEINFFSFIFMVEMADVDRVKEALLDCYNKIEVVYNYSELASKPSGSTHTLLLMLFHFDYRRYLWDFDSSCETNSCSCMVTYK
uniref:Uncharacterized protein n=1 Tax=Amphimedon queenslandica TaxID=400682 RepID=A0A1X7UA32_AMPQE